ncbi:MAG: transcription antitermination factor NusB [Omnitrophica WOR_2 bacterium GWA2_47_8]|nr:MAG: transcription antitermination factor NusB [Omnitrophica WOR_2 bacterium GWA2_47_8]
MRKRTLARENALKILYQAEMTKRPVETSSLHYFENEPCEDAEIVEFTKRLIAGVEKNLQFIDGKIADYATNWQLKRMAVIDRNVLRIGVFELQYASDIPPKVTINEAVELAKKYGDLDSSKFVNGILDKFHKKEIVTQRKSP